MNKRCKHELQSYLKEIRSRYKNEKERLDQLQEYASKRLKITQDKTGKIYYSVYEPDLNKYRYLGNENNELVCKIKEAHFLKASVSELLQEISMIENVLKQCRGASYEDINNKLNKAYKTTSISYMPAASTLAADWKQSMENYKKTFPVFRPEELIHKTRDGNYVRSKGEALIYNYLLELGVTFVYELPLRVHYNHRETMIIPDFTILSEIDYKTVIFIEHQGMMSDSNYRTGFNEKLYKYWSNNYLPERDVFFTFDLPNGGFDDTPIKSIVQRYVKPIL